MLSGCPRLLPVRPPPSRRSLLGALGGTAAARCPGRVRGARRLWRRPVTGPCPTSPRSTRGLTWANWPLYIDTDDDHPDRRPTLRAFERRTGISVDYVEEINDNDEFFGKISPALMNHQSTGRDLIVISDWMCARYVRLGWVQEMDRARQPSVAEHLDPLLRSTAFDKGPPLHRAVAVGITGIALQPPQARPGDTRRLRPLGEGPQGPGDPALRPGRGVRAAHAGQRRGTSPGGPRTTSTGCCEQVERQVHRGQIRRFTGNDYTQDLVSGDVLACQAYSGDVMQLQADNPRHPLRRPRGGRRAVVGLPDDPPTGPGTRPTPSG